MVKPVVLLSAVALVLSGCSVPVGTVYPQRAVLDRGEVLYIVMSNREVCEGPRPADAASASEWNGVLENCAYPFAYTVEDDDLTNPVRIVLDEVTEALGAPDLLQPETRVTVTNADGKTYIFRGP